MSATATAMPTASTRLTMRSMKSISCRGRAGALTPPPPAT